jgi:hypothetical protein
MGDQIVNAEDGVHIRLDCHGFRAGLGGFSVFIDAGILRTCSAGRHVHELIPTIRSSASTDF